MGQFDHVQRLEAGESLNFRREHREYAEQVMEMAEVYGLSASIKPLPSKRGWTVSAVTTDRALVSQPVREMAARHLELRFSIKHHRGPS
jgi:hypothetical protein